MAEATTQQSKSDRAQVPDFGSVASSYAMLEKIVFRGALQRARLAHIDLIIDSNPEKILLTGDGDGRFLEVLVGRLPNAQVTTVDSSQRMLAKSAERIGLDPSTKGRIRFIHGDLLQPAPEAPAQYDIVVSHFVLDCFSTEQVAQIAHAIASRMNSNGKWIVTDFQNPPPSSSMFTRFGRAALLRAMYFFFRITTGLHTAKLPDFESAIHSAGFETAQQSSHLKGFVTSTVYRLGN